jgi:acetyltransferase-like isoleucine patch superfamily enzyme
MTSSSENRASRIGHEFNPFCWIIGQPKIGRNTWIGLFTLLDASGGLEIGEGCDVSSGVQIYTHSSVLRCVSGRNFPEIERQNTLIGSKVFIGAGSIILMGTQIGDSCVIAAGSVVKGIIPSYSIVAGSPARIIGRVELKDSKVALIYET